MKSTVFILLWGLLTSQVLGLSVDEAREACTGAHQAWDSSLNRCVTTNEAIGIANQTNECAGSSDPDSCYMQQAEGKTGVKEGDKLETSKLEMVGQIVAGAYATFSLVTSMAALDRYTGYSKKETTGCMSKKIFQITSVAWIAGDLYLRHSAKKSFEKMAEDYKSEQSNEELKGSADSSYQAQVRAFHYLRQEQEQIKKQADHRSKLQMAVTLGYGAALGFSIYELFNPAKACTSVDKMEGDTPKPEGGVGQAAAGRDAAAGDPRKSFANQIVRLGSSAQIMVGSGIMLGLNSFLIIHAKREKSRAEDNITNIDEVLATYSQYMAGFCPDGREDINNDRCYCYNDDGSKNDNRTQSVICQNLFAQDDKNYALQNKALAPLAEGPRQGCVTVTGQFDADCKCRKMINSTTKQNACAQAPSSTSLSGGFGAQLDAPNTMSTLGSFPNGANNALASLNSADLANRVAKTNRLVDKLVGDSKKKNPNIKGPNDLKGLAKKLALSGDKKKDLEKFNGALKPSGRQFGALPKGLETALEKAEGRISTSAASKISLKSSGKGRVGAGKSNNGFKFKWNDAAAREGNKVQTFMEKDYNYKGSDIVKRDDVSLWNVISNRYQTSGLRRLFGEDEDEEE